VDNSTGRPHRVVCLECRALSRRDEPAERLREANAGWLLLLLL
jgi:hypothetical protein